MFNEVKKRVCVAGVVSHFVFSRFFMVLDYTVFTMVGFFFPVIIFFLSTERVLYGYDKEKK